MQVKYEAKITFDGAVIANREVTIADSDKDIIKTAIMAGILKCTEKMNDDLTKAFNKPKKT